MARKTGIHLCSFHGLLILMPIRKTTNSPSISADTREPITLATRSPLSVYCASEPVYGRENRSRPGPHTDILGQIHPADAACRIDQEFGGSRDVLAVPAALGMQHSVLANGLSVGIGKNRKRI